MVDLARHVHVTSLFEDIAAVEDQLTANELEMVRHLREKYADPGHGDFDDAHVLEVILRNVGIRKGFDIDARNHTPRAIEMERKKD
jgi:hypothetical protein